jgi:hypothetical protein
VSALTPPHTSVVQTASLCQTCQSTTVNTQGPGAVIGGVSPPPPPPPPSFPFATKVCIGENSGGTASPGQLDSCSVSASGGNSYHPGESVIVKPNSPVGSTVADCSGFTAGSYQTSGMVNANGSCRLTVVSGTVRQFEMLGTETVRLAADAQPGTPLQQLVNFCNGPTATGDSSCTAALGFIPISGPGASLSPDPPVHAAGVSVGATEGQAFSGTVATFSDADPRGSFSDYAATVDWGDGTASTVGLTGGNAALGGFDVTGSHTYLEEGAYTITVSVSDIDTALFNTTTATTGAVVGDASLTAAGRDANTTNPFNGLVATFTDANPNGSLSDFSATIDWGDNTSSTGTISQSSGAFVVGGAHTYANLGPYTVTAHICDVGGSCADALSHLLVYGLSSGGNFVVGDGNAAIGSPVTYWGAKWASANTLSGGAAPDSFKGFADDPAAAPSCRSLWSTGPGNSAGPPAEVPTYVAVIVASSVSTSGPRISGDSVKVVIVKADTGFGPDPGHPGTGTVVAQLC